MPVWHFAQVAASTYSFFAWEFTASGLEHEAIATTSAHVNTSQALFHRPITAR
jgi:hypothetical protein